LDRSSNSRQIVGWVARSQNSTKTIITYKREFKMTSIDLVGYIAATLTTAAFLPQVWKVWKSKSTKDLALPTLLSFIAGVAMWLVYGLLVQSTPIVIANIVTLVLNLMILRFKLRYG
jgi:MtN3 and saliva related transmembrane protein